LSRSQVRRHQARRVVVEEQPSHQLAALRRWSVGANSPILYWLHPDWTSIVPQFLFIGAYSAVFVLFAVWLLGGRSPALNTD
jgi:hypothetical protein